MADGHAAESRSEVGMARSTKARLGVAAAALAFYAIFVFRTSFMIAGTRYFVLFEDAMISMRYAKHLATGHGLVWNIGEPPIEGFTNLLWVLWMSVAHFLGLSESKISLFIMLTGVATMLATGLVASKVARKISSAAWVPVAVMAATLFDYPLVFWTLRGMEVGALTLFVYTLLWLALENEDDFSVPRTLAMGVMTSLCLLIRSDSVVPVGLISLYAFLTSRRRFLLAAIIGMFAGSAVLGQTMFRKAYFHETLPNTYFLKLHKIALSARVKRGAFVALEVLALHLAVPICIALAGVFGVDKDFYKDKTKRRLLLLGAIFSAQIAYATYVGGDAWEWMLYANRYTCVGMPALIVLVAASLQFVAHADAETRAAFAKRFSLGLVASGGVLLALNVYGRLRPEEGVARTIQFSTTAAAAGGGLIVLGALLRMKDAREGITVGLAALGTRLASRKTVTVAALGIMALVWLPAHLLPFGRWAMSNAAQYEEEANYTRLGLLIKATTPPQLRMAVAAAGATPYFAERPTEDLLGKNDRHIAKLAPRGVFSPGHDKWDYEWSLGERGSHLIVEPVDVNPADEAYMARLGFEELPNKMLLRKDAPVARRDVLGRVMDSGATVAASLAEVGVALPPGLVGADIGVILAFFALIAITGRALVKDDDSLAALSPDAPPEIAPDASSEAALKGADARAIPTLDGMRGLAVIAVLTFHFAWTFPGEDRASAVSAFDKLAVHVHEFLWSGWSGVDLFFVLSGYLITRGLVTPSKHPLGSRMRMFWMRRVLRIFPLYYAVIIVGTIVVLAMGQGGYIPTWPYWLYMQNYALAFDPPEQVLKWVAHFWSLAIEEQFYFVWPIVALTVSRRRLIPTILILTLLTVGLRGVIAFKGMSLPGLSTLFHGDEEYVKKFVYRATFTRADGLLLGAFVAVTQREVLHPVSRIWRQLRFPIFVGTALALAGLYAVCHGWNDYDRRMMAVGYVCLALFFATTVSLCADGSISNKARNFLSWSPLVACGKVSYGMYIFHWPLVVALVPWLKGRQPMMALPMQFALCSVVIGGGLVVSYLAATLSFRFFEQPFLKLKGKFHE